MRERSNTERHKGNPEICRDYVGTFLIFSVLVGLSLVFNGLNPNHGTSPDSVVYLQIATDFSSYDGTFPIGYPALIRLVSWLTGLDVLWASKVVNLLAVGVSGLLWAKRLGPGRAVWLLSVWLLGQFVRIVAFTWSETVFLVLLAEVVWVMVQCQNQPDRVRIIRLLVVLMVLFLVRYVGGFLVVVMVIVLIFSRKAKTPGSFKTQTMSPRQGSFPAKWRAVLLTGHSDGVIGGVVLAFGLVIISYFALNQQLTGSFWGGSRFSPVESPGALAGLFGWALLNEILLIRDFLPGYSTGLAWLGAVLQIGWIVGAGRGWFDHPQPPPKIGGGFSVRSQSRRLCKAPSCFRRGLGVVVSPQSSRRTALQLARLFLLTAGVYVVVLFGLRTISPFDTPNARLMAPATFCAVWAALLWLTEQPGYESRLRWYWVVLTVASWLELAPHSLSVIVDNWLLITVH